MSLSGIQCVQKCFSIIAGHLQMSNESKWRLDDSKYPDDVLNLADLKVIKSEAFSFGVRICWLENASSQERYLVILHNDFFDLEAINKGLNAYSIEEAELYPSIFLRVLGDVSFPINLNKNLNKDDLFAYVSDNFTFLDPDEILKCYENILVFKLVDESSLWEVEPFAFYCLLLTYNSKRLSLSHSEIFLTRSRDYLVENKNTKIPLDTFEMALTSQYWKHSFLESYRALESLYSIPRAIDLKGKMSALSSMSAILIARQCKESLGWRNQELDSLKKLLKITLVSNADMQFYESLGVFLELIIGKCDWGVKSIEDKTERIAKLIYSIRNQNVHLELSYADQVQKLTDLYYADLVTALWNLSFDLYNKLHVELELNPETFPIR